MSTSDNVSDLCFHQSLPVDSPSLFWAVFLPSSKCLLNLWLAGKPSNHNCQAFTMSPVVRNNTGSGARLSGLEPPFCHTPAQRRAWELVWRQARMAPDTASLHPQGNLGDSSPRRVHEIAYIYFQLLKAFYDTYFLAFSLWYSFWYSESPPSRPSLPLHCQLCSRQKLLPDAMTSTEVRSSYIKFLFLCPPS